ncbi:MAG TPA: PrgI family protein [Candidatus Saccharimonadia bacterium]
MGTYKVPQNVEAEDKILGPLSMKQFIYALIGLGYGLLTFAILKSVILLWILVGLPPALALLALGLYQRQDQSMETYLISIAQFIGRPKSRVWQKEPVAEVFHLEPPPPKPRMETRDSRKVRSQLAQLANVVDTHGWATKQPQVQEADQQIQVVDLNERIGDITLPVEPRQEIHMPEVTDADDMLNISGAAAQNLDNLIANSIQSLRADVLEKMAAGSALPPMPSTSGMTTPPSGDIVKLAAEGGDLTVAQLASQARRQIAAIGEGAPASVQNASPQPN